jgi:signal transduction histidine kinase
MNSKLEEQVGKRQAAEDEIRRLYEYEKTLRKRIEKQNDQRIEFTRALVHELKTPLTPILAATELMSAEESREPVKSLVHRIDRGARNLERRIDELLDLARGEVGLLHLHCTDINPLEIVEEAIDYVRPQITNNMQTMISGLPDSLPVISGDAERLRQVILNLLNNAIKFTASGGIITVNAKIDQSLLLIEVSDTGCGISKKELPFLFEPYYCFENDGDRLSGLGLGLSLSKMLVELHGGDIWASSERGKGSTFSFSIPLTATDLSTIKVPKQLSEHSLIRR